MVEKGESSCAGNKPDRKTIERNRRIQMKDLCYNLVSIIPAGHFSPAKEFLSQNDQLDQAADYITLLKERVDELRRRKTQLLTGRDSKINASSNGVVTGGSELPILKITDSGPNLEVVLISCPLKNFKVHQVIAILEEEGANVVTVTISRIGDNIVHAFHSQAKFSRIGVDTPTICQRVHELIS